MDIDKGKLSPQEVGSRGGNRTKETHGLGFYARIGARGNEVQRANGWNRRKRGKDKQPRKRRGRVERIHAQENTNG